MNTFRIMSQALVMTAVVFVGGVYASEGEKKPKKVEPKTDYLKKFKENGKVVYEGSSQNFSLGTSVVVAAVNTGVKSPEVQSAVATAMKMAPEYYAQGRNLDRSHLGVTVAFGLGNYAGRVAINTVSDKVGGFNGVANKVDVLPEQVMGYKVRSNVNPVVKSTAQYLAPIAKEVACDQAGFLTFLALVAAKNYASSWMNSSASTSSSYKDN